MSARMSEEGRDECEDEYGEEGGGDDSRGVQRFHHEQ